MLFSVAWCCWRRGSTNSHRSNKPAYGTAAHPSNSFSPVGATVPAARFGWAWNMAPIVWAAVGSSWGLLFFGGVMNLYWIAGIAVFVLLEKSVPGGRWLGLVTGIILIAGEGSCSPRSLDLTNSECLVLVISGRQQAPSITTGLHPKADVDLPMSAFLLITSGVGGKAAVDCRR